VQGKCLIISFIEMSSVIHNSENFSIRKDFSSLQKNDFSFLIAIQASTCNSPTSTTYCGESVYFSSMIPMNKRNLSFLCRGKYLRHRGEFFRRRLLEADSYIIIGYNLPPVKDLSSLQSFFQRRKMLRES
jgi:hypothetical protein